MYNVKTLSALLCATAVVVHLSPHHAADGRPRNSLSRQKRISDQRLAELETLIALSKMKNKMVTIPIGFGRVDPLKVGRRKRSIEDLIMRLAPELDTSEEIAEEAEMENEKENVGYAPSHGKGRQTKGYPPLTVRFPE